VEEKTMERQGHLALDVGFALALAMGLLCSGCAVAGGGSSSPEAVRAPAALLISLTQNPPVEDPPVADPPSDEPKPDEPKTEAPAPEEPEPDAPEPGESPPDEPAEEKVEDIGPPPPPLVEPPAPIEESEPEGFFYEGSLAYALGRYKFDVRGFHDKESAWMLRLRQEAGKPMGEEGLSAGGGIALELTEPDDMRGEMDIDSFDFLLYGMARIETEENVRVPLRAGLYINQVETDGPTWNSYGLRVEAQPEVMVPMEGEFEVSFYLSIASGLHFSAVSDTRNDDHIYENPGYTLGLSLGAKGVIEKEHGPAISTGLEILQRRIWLDGPDASGRFTGVALFLGIGF
jgi:hypothetical protein